MRGIKSTISIGGTPSVNLSLIPAQHVGEWIMASEDVTNGHSCLGTTTCCLAINQCTIQVGWEIGVNDPPSNFPGCATLSSGQTPIVYVEIFDDTSAPCFRDGYGTAPSIAAYDTRFYATQPNGLQRYNVYYEAPDGISGSNNIQVLAYGDYRSQYTEEYAALEVFASHDGAACPHVTNAGQWDYHGKPTSPPDDTFAGPLSLYNSSGSWANWNSSTAPHTSQIATPPYQLSIVSSEVAPV